MTTHESVVTVFEGNNEGNWKPKNLEDRFAGKEFNHEERLRTAELRRADLRSELISRVSAHHARVKDIRRKRDQHMGVEKIFKKQTMAETRRSELQTLRVQRVAQHHQKIDTLIEKKKRKVPAWKLSQRHRKAEERRQSRLLQQRQQLSEHAEKVNKAREMRRENEEKNKTVNRKILNSFRLDSKAIEEASFEEMQRRLSSRQTITHANDLLQLIGVGFEKVMAEERKRISEETPISTSISPASQPSSPRPASTILGNVTSGKVPLNPRIFLSAFICMGGMTEGIQHKIGDLEQSVKQHAISLIDALHELLKCLHEDATFDTQHTKDKIKTFAREWTAYTTSFEAWKKNDKDDLLQHYIHVYSEMERGKADIIAETAVKGTREPEKHAELMNSIEESLNRVRSQIEKLSGNEGIEQLSRRLQEMYTSQQNTPNRTPTHSTMQANLPSPFTSDLESSDMNATPKKIFDINNTTHSTTPNSNMTTPFDTSMSSNSPNISPQSGPSIPPDAREKLQTLVLKAKLAHDTIFNIDSLKEDESSEENSNLNDTFSDESSENSSQQNAGIQRLPITVQRIKKAAEEAFWDLTTAELRENPPKVSRIGGALEALKSLLLEATPKSMLNQQKKELEESFDWSIMQTSFNTSTLTAIVQFFIEKILYLEAPSQNNATKQSRDEVITYITQHSSTEELHLTIPYTFKFLNKKLEDLSKSIHKARKMLVGPLLAQDSEGLVKQLFNQETSAGIHSFEKTKKWLKFCIEKMVAILPKNQVRNIYEANKLITTEDILQKTNKLFTMVPTLSIIDSILHPNDFISTTMPETLRLHNQYIKNIIDKIQMIILSAVMSGLCGQISGSNKVATVVASEVLTILKVPGMRINKVIDHVAHVVDRENSELIPTAKRDLLMSMLKKVVNPEEKLFVTYQVRLANLLLQTISTPATVNETVSKSPFSTVMAEVTELFSMISKLTLYNLRWCRPFYDKILNELSQEYTEQRQSALEEEEL